MAKSKTIKSAPLKVNASDITFERPHKAVVHFNDAIIIELTFDAETRKLSAKLTNDVEKITLNGEVVLTEGGK